MSPTATFLSERDLAHVRSLGFQNLGTVGEPEKYELHVRATVAGIGPIDLKLEWDNPFPLWARSVVTNMIELLGLGPNWDSYGARPVELRAIQNAIEVLLSTASTIRTAPVVVPTTSGGVQLEWHRNGRDLEVEVTADGRVGVFYSGPEATNEWDGDAKDLAEVVVGLVSRID